MKELKVTMKNDCVECESCRSSTKGASFFCGSKNICNDIVCETCEHKNSTHVSQINEIKCNLLGDMSYVIGCHHYKLKEKR